MKKNKVDMDMPVGRLKRIPDFLPIPSELAEAEKTIKITIALKKSSIDFFKKQASIHHTMYQRMIRDLIDKYAMQFSR